MFHGDVRESVFKKYILSNVVALKVIDSIVVRWTIVNAILVTFVAAACCSVLSPTSPPLCPLTLRTLGNDDGVTLLPCLSSLLSSGLNAMQKVVLCHRGCSRNVASRCKVLCFFRLLTRVRGIKLDGCCGLVHLT